MHEMATILNRPYSSLRSRVGQLQAGGALPLLSQADREARVVKSRERRSAKLQARASAYMASMPNTKDIGYVIGVLYGDGFTNFKDVVLGIPKSFGMSTTNESFRNAFADALETWRGADSVKRATHLVKEVVAPDSNIYKDVLYYDAWLHDRYLITELLRIIGPTQTDIWSINIDDAMKRGSAFCDGIIQGLFDSDGSFSAQPCDGIGIKLGTVSFKGAESLYELMKIRGYDVAWQKPLLLPSDKWFYHVSVRTMTSWLQYANEIGSRIDYKSKTLTDFIQRRRNHRP